MSQDDNRPEKIGLTKKIEQKLSPVLTKRNQTIFFVITVILAAVSIYDVITECFPTPVSIVIYICTGICFFSSCALWIRMLSFMFRIVLFPFVERHRFLSIFVHDYKLRTVITALPGLGLNFIFAVFNAVLGIMYQNAWHGSLAAYYIFLCVIRLVSVMYAKSIYIDRKEESQTEREIKVHKICGILLSCMSLVIFGAMILLLNGSSGKTYSGVMIYVVAAYTFWKLFLSIRNMIRARHEDSLLAVTLRNIGHCDALVSLLNLQTALLAAFSEGSALPISVMNAATGLAVCLAALVIGQHMVYTAGKLKKKGMDAS